MAVRINQGIRLQRLLDIGLQRNLMGYAGGLAARGLEIIGKFGLYVLVARSLGAMQSGLFFLCLTWVNLACTICRLGLERTTTRHIAAERVVGRGSAAKRAIINSMIAVTAASLAGAALTMAVAEPAARFGFHQPELAGPLTVAAIILPCQTITWGLAFVLVGLKRTVAPQFLLSALPSVLTLGALLCGVHDVNHLLLAYAASFLFCGLAGAVFVAIDWPSLVDTAPPDGVDTAPLPPLLQEARPFLVIEVIQTLVLSLPTLLLARFASPASVSEFNIAMRLSNLVNTVILSVGTVAAPVFAEQQRRRQFAQLRRTVRQMQLLTLALNCVPLAMMLFAPVFVLHMMAKDFGHAWLALVILGTGQFVNAMFPCQDTLLAMTGHGQILRRLNMWQLALCLSTGLAFIPIWGTTGAAITSAAALILYAIGCAVAAQKAVLHETSEIV